MKSTEREKQRHRAHLNAAKAYAQLSHAQRLKVGAVLVKDDRIISVGYNGTPSGRNNVCEELVEISLMPNGLFEPGTRTKSEVVHAEMNVIAFAAKNGTPTNECIMFITHSPCYECSKLIVQSGIKAVYYETEYRIRDGVQFLNECHVVVRKIDGEEEVRQT
jgi:dCMP deaminase